MFQESGSNAETKLEAGEIVHRDQLSFPSSLLLVWCPMIVGLDRVVGTEISKCI